MTAAFNHNLLAGAVIQVAHGYSTVHPDMDFETYSDAGYVWHDEKGHFVGITENDRGLSAVGSAVYAEHPTCEVLTMFYNLKDGLGERKWHPGLPPPVDLFAHLADGGLIEAHNAIFEYFIWSFVCVRKYGWPPLDPNLMRCSMSKAAAFSLPMALDKLGTALNSDIQKDKAGQAVMRKVTCPRIPTLKDPSLRYTRIAHPNEFATLDGYCARDIRTESSISAMLPDLQPDELDLWLLDQRINARGAHIDREALDNCIVIVNQAFEKYVYELVTLTGGFVQSAQEFDKIRQYLAAKGVTTDSVDAEHVEKLLARSDLPPECRRVLELRQILGASSVKKLFAMARQTNLDGRIRGLFAFCGADRTGRFAGRGPQPQNLPSSGPTLHRCDRINGCGHHYGGSLLWCPWCGLEVSYADSHVEWNAEAAEQAYKVIAARRLDYMEHYYGDAIAIISACLRGLYTASEGNDLVCSDFSAIEAVVAAELSGETWRQEVFRTHGKIYETSAARTFSVPLETILNHKKETGSHHPLRKKGKVGELASGYGGWIGAYRNFGAEGTDEELRDMVLAWRAASPAIVEMWGGQWRETAPGSWKFSPEFYGLEGAAVQAVIYPGQAFAYRDITYVQHGNVLYCRLPSGRLLSYHAPVLHKTVSSYHKKEQWQLTYLGQNDKGHWTRLDTYGGKLFENVVQAVARDILTFAMRNLERAGYWIVLHVHDEIVAEVNKAFGSVEEFERIMSTMPPWAAGWPVKAAGGWRGLRYRKE